MSEELTIETAMRRMPKAFDPEKGWGVKATVQYHLTGDEAGDWLVRIADGKCDVEQGSVDDASLTLTVDSSDYLAILKGELNPMGAFADGKLKLKGDLPLAMKLMGFFKLPS